MIERVLTSLVRLPGAPDFLILGLAAAVYLLIFSPNLRPPLNDRLQGFSLVLAGFCIGNLLLAMILGVDLHFEFLESAAAQSHYVSKSQKTETTSRLARKNLANEEDSHLIRNNEDRREKDLPPGNWREVVHWEGSNPKQTEVFRITTRPWLISFHGMPLGKQPGILSIRLHRANGEFVKSVAYITGAGNDSILVQDSGNYYLSINATEKYRVVVMTKN